MKKPADNPRLLLATHNQAKLGELKKGCAWLTKHGIKVISLHDIPAIADPEETGKTFAENAVLKAKYYAERSGLPVIADDGGLTIDILNGEPGVRSRRWLGYDAGDSELIAYTLQRLKGYTGTGRNASLQTTLCYFNPKTKALYLETGKISGHIAGKPSSKPSAGYPYRALFVVDAFGVYYDDLTEHEHRQINHRLQALSRLTNKIKADLIE